MVLPTNQEIDNAIRTSNTGTDADRPIRLSTNELLKAFRQEIANTQQDLANKVNNSTFNALAQVARTGDYNDLSERPQQYGSTGQNTDGYMTQKAVTVALGDKADLVGGKVPFEQLPSSLASGVVFKGTWNAATNQDNGGNPLPATPINDSEYYIVNTAGTQFSLTFAAGDWIIAVDGQWYKLEPDSTVSSVNGQTGTVVIDVGVTSVGITVPTGLVVATTPITNAGTIDIELAAGYKIPTEAELEDKGIEPPAGWLEEGNETKYLAGDGTLKDIPSDTQSDYAQANPNAPDYIKNKPALFSGSYDDLEGKPTIPTKTSELENDSEFITDASLADLEARVDAALTKTFTPWQPEVIGTGIDLPNVIDMLGSSDPITLTGSTLRMERTGFPSALDAYLANGLKSDSFSFGDTTSLYYKVKSSLDVEVAGTSTYIGFANSAFDSWATVVASISGGTFSLNSIGDLLGGDDNTEFSPPIEVPVTEDTEYCLSYDKLLNKVTFFVDGAEIASHAFATDFGFDVVTGSVAVDATNYQGDPSALTLWSETEFLSDPAYPITGLEPLIISSASTIDETKYPENPEGKGYEIVGLAQPAQWDELGKEVKNGDLIVFDNDGMPKTLGEEVDLSDYTQRSRNETITGDWDFQGAMQVGDYTYNAMFGPYPVEKIITYTHPSLSSPMNIAYGIDAGYSFASMAVAFNADDLGLGEFITTELFTEEGGIAGGYTTVYSTTSKENDGTVEKRMVIAAYADGGVGASISVVSRSDGVSYIELETGTETVHGLYASDILTESAGITIKAALDNKVNKIQVKETVTANKTLTAADSGKLLIINADGITITLPASSDFNIDIAKMDEDFTTIVQCAGTDNFREGTATISVIRDVSITNTGITGKEWLAIGAYEA